MLCSGRSNLKKLFNYLYIISIDGSFFTQVHILKNQECTCSCTTCIVYVNLFKDRSFHDCCSFQKADAKVRTLKHIFQIFSEVFFYFFSFLFPRRLSCRKGGKKKKEEKNRSPFLERRMSTRAAFVFKSGCKGKDFKA